VYENKDHATEETRQEKLETQLHDWKTEIDDFTAKADELCAHATVKFRRELVEAH
jgi:hypothetical protein